MKNVLCTMRNRTHLFLVFNGFLILIAFSAFFFSCEIINDVIPGKGDLEVTTDIAGNEGEDSIFLYWDRKAPSISKCELEPETRNLSVTGSDSGSGPHDMMVWAINNQNKAPYYHDGSGYNSTSPKWISYRSSLPGTNMPPYYSYGSSGGVTNRYEAHVVIKDLCGNTTEVKDSNIVTCNSSSSGSNCYIEE
jgi:hypothetical protein